MGFFRASTIIKIAGGKSRLEVQKIIQWLFPHAHALARRTTRYDLYQTFAIFVAYKLLNSLNGKLSVFPKLHYIIELGTANSFDYLRAHTFKIKDGGVTLILDMAELIEEFKEKVKETTNLALEYVECRYRTFVIGGVEHGVCSKQNRDSQEAID